MRGRPKKEVEVQSKKETIKKVIKKEVKEEKSVSKPKSKKEETKSTPIIDEIFGELIALDKPEDHFFPSGSLVLDAVLSNGRGIPAGKFISITSSEGVGKSTICLHIARNCCAKGYKCLFIDTEVGTQATQLENFSMMSFVRNGTFIPKNIQTYRELDDTFAKALKYVNEEGGKLKFIFLDSLTDVTPDQVLTTNIADINQPGIDARAQSLFFRKYKKPITDAGITVFFVLQQRTKIGMSWGEKSVDQGAGSHAAKHAMDIALELTRKNYLTKTVKGHAEPIKFGSECIIQSIKNRYAPPFIPMTLHIHWGKGVSNSGAIASALILNGIAKTPSSKKFIIEYQGEMKEFLGKPRFEEFIKEHLDYYKDIIENKCGGIRLLREEDESKPVVTYSDDNIDDIEDDDVEESDEEDDVDDIEEDGIEESNTDILESKEEKQES